MALKGIYKTDVVTCSPDTPITEAARLMKEYSVGNVVVVDEERGVRRAVGMITDRDIVLGAVCDRSEDIDDMKVSELMTPDVVTLNEEMGVLEALKTMREAGVARVPVVRAEGELCGVLSASAVFRLLSEEIKELSLLSDQRKEFPEHVKRGSASREGRRETSVH